MAVLYYGTGEAVCLTALKKSPNSPSALLASNHNGMGASLKE
jgi:hypothetical protein